MTCVVMDGDEATMNLTTQGSRQLTSKMCWLQTGSTFKKKGAQRGRGEGAKRGEFEGIATPLCGTGEILRVVPLCGTLGNLKFFRVKLFCRTFGNLNF